MIFLHDLPQGRIKPNSTWLISLSIPVLRQAKNKEIG
jgi:hypothetical protein